MQLQKSIRLVCLAAVAVLAAAVPSYAQDAVTVKNTCRAAWSLSYAKDSGDYGKLVGKVSVKIGSQTTAIANASDKVKLDKGGDATLVLTREGGKLNQVVSFWDGPGAHWVTLCLSAKSAGDPVKLDWGGQSDNTSITLPTLKSDFIIQDKNTLTIKKEILPN